MPPPMNAPHIALVLTRASTVKVQPDGIGSDERMAPVAVAVRFELMGPCT